MAKIEFTAEETAILATVERFVHEKVRPQVAAFERAQAYPQALVDKMRELGLYGVAVPEEFGGLGLRTPAFARVMEIMSSGWTTLAAYINSHSTVAHAIAEHGTDGQRKTYLPAMATGAHHGALCLTEPDCGSDLQAIRTTARDEGDHYRVRGTKVYVTNGDRATLLLTLVKHPQASPSAKPKISLLLIEKAYPNLSVTTHFSKTGFGLVDTVQIELDDVLVPKRQLLGSVEAKGFAHLMESLEVGRIAIAISAVGLAGAALSEARRYASQRKTFGATIDKHQAIQLKLADMATKLLAARLLSMEAARLKDSGGRCDMVSAMAKVFASEAAFDIAYEAVRIHGGAGYITEYAVGRLHREALLYVIGEGSNEINRLVIARRLNDDVEARSLGLFT